jgi:hypothetical protein
MTSDGARLPEKNAFEFTVRPKSTIEKGQSRSGGSSKDNTNGKQKI